MFITDLNGNPVYLGWQFDPVLIGNLLTLSVLYILATTVLRRRLAPGEVFPKRQAIFFFSGVAVLWLAEGTPLHDLSERYLLSAHMVQHLLINYFSAPLLIWGTPEWVFRPLLLNHFVKPIAKALLQPVVAAVVFNLGLSLWHFPQIYDAGLRNSTVHHFQHVIFLTLSFISWWPVMSPLKEIPRLNYGLQILYIFATSTLLQIPLFGIVTFADQVLYPTYQNAARVWIAQPLNDQIMAGLIMKVLGMIIYGIPLIVIFFKWYAESQGPKKVTTQPAKTSS
jgi:putative membrane protein